MKKLISLVLAICMLLATGALFSCNKKEAENSSETTAAEQTEASKEVSFLVSNLSELRVIRSSMASKAVYDAAKSICDALEKVLGFRPAFASDYIQEGSDSFFESEYEILVGDCTGREEVETLGKAMRANDYAYTAVGSKIIIRGGSEETLQMAISRFIREVVEKCDGKADSYLYRSEQDFFQEGKYNVAELLVNGDSVGDYTIVFPKDNKMYEERLAQRLSDAIFTASGYRLLVVSDTEPVAGKEIRIGVTSRDKATSLGALADENSYKILNGAQDGVVLYGNSLGGILGAIEAMTAQMQGSNGAKISLDYGTAKSGNRAGKQLTAMSFNILTTKPSNERADRVVGVILKYMPDTVGLQEVSPYWQGVLKTKLAEYYNWVGEGRDGGNSGEYNTIFYRKDLFTLKESGTKWLSKTPDVVSRVGSSSLNRILTYAVLERKSDGAEFVHVNTHLEHTSATARTEQMEVLLSIISRFEGMPLFLTGDFNCVDSESTYKLVTSKGFVDVGKTALQAESGATFPSSGKVIDFIFANNMVYPATYEVESERIAEKDPSDHNAIFMKYEI